MLMVFGPDATRATTYHFLVQYWRPLQYYHLFKTYICVLGLVTRPYFAKQLRKDRPGNVLDFLQVAKLST